MQLPMVVAVIAERVLFGGDAARELGPAFHVASEQEERGGNVFGTQRVENPGSCLGIRAVIEGQRHATFPCGEATQCPAEHGAVPVERAVRRHSHRR
jgi:hypothetical protein